MTQNELETITITTEKVLDSAVYFFEKYRIDDWEINEIILTSKSSPEQKIICETIYEGGKKKRVCRLLDD